MSIYRLTDCDMNTIGFYTDEESARNAAQEICDRKIELPYELEEDEEDIYIMVTVIKANAVGSIPCLLEYSFYVGAY